ncbi:hypothetical protein C0J52_27041 [Blattella germanica]|nr:hypothetical protein C0J52_27041 [Blattella germanica]
MYKDEARSLCALPEVITLAPRKYENSNISSRKDMHKKQWIKCYMDSAHTSDGKIVFCQYCNKQNTKYGIGRKHGRSKRDRERESKKYSMRGGRILAKSGPSQVSPGSESLETHQAVDWKLQSGDIAHLDIWQPTGSKIGYLNHVGSINDNKTGKSVGAQFVQLKLKKGKKCMQRLTYTLHIYIRNLQYRSPIFFSHIKAFLLLSFLCWSISRDRGNAPRQNTTDRDTLIQSKCTQCETMYMHPISIFLFKETSGFGPSHFDEGMPPQLKVKYLFTDIEKSELAPDDDLIIDSPRVNIL